MTLAFAHPGVSAGGRIFGLDLTNDGALLAVACMPRAGAAAVQVWRTEDAELVATFGLGDEVGRGLSAGSKAIHSPGVAFVNGGRDLWFGLSTKDEGPSLWRAGPEGPPERLGHYTPEQFEGLVRSRDGRMAGILGSNFEIRDVAAGGEIVRYIPKAGTPNDSMRACFSAHEASVWLYGREAGAVVRHDLTTGKDTQRYEAPTPFGRHVATSPSGQWLLVSGRKGTWLYDTATGERHDTVDSPVLSFGSDTPGHLGAFAPDERSLLVLASRLYSVDLASPKLHATSGPNKPNPGATIAVAAAHDAPVFAWATDDNFVVWGRR